MSRARRASVSVTNDFRQAFESDRRDLMRRRFLIYALTICVIQLLMFAMMWELFVFDSIELERIALGFITLCSSFIFLGGWFYVRNASRRLSRNVIVWLTIGLILGTAFLRLPYALLNDESALSSPLTTWAVAVMASHIVASFFIPWTAREALIPFGPVLLAMVVISAVRDGLGGVAGALFVVFVIAAPGTLIALWQSDRHRTSFQNRFLRKSYTSMKRELVDARRIHEDLFPAELEDGPVRVRYAYEPMQQIGGDYLFIRSTPSSTSVVLIDVTGHGVTAALTINRLHGEMQRHFGEHPDTGPGDALTALNSYIHLTLATHSVYATAVGVRIDHEKDELRYASAGHPPAFLVGYDSTINQLDSTTFLLGVCHGDDFKHEERTLPFHEGDTLVAYTDGATEAMDADGRMLGVMGFLRTVASLEPGKDGWPQMLKHEIEAYRDGPADDDTLIVELARPLEL